MSMSSCGAGNFSPAAPQSIKPPVNRSTSVPTARTKTHRERQVARKAFAPNDTVREKVRYLAGLGVRQDDIAKIIDCNPKTLRTRLREELDRGVAEAGNIAAIIFWLKTRAHWRESTPPDEPKPGADAEANPPVVLVLPDNNRDPDLTQAMRDAQEKYFTRKPRP